MENKINKVQMKYAVKTLFKEDPVADTPATSATYRKKSANLTGGSSARGLTLTKSSALQNKDLEPVGVPKAAKDKS